MQSDSDSEIEDLMNPRDELKKKIVDLAGIIRKWNEETVKVRKTVREQLDEIANLGLNKYHMERTALRRLVEEIFRYHSISESWLRKLLPEELKDSSKTRISYQQRQEIEKERQRLVQLQQQQQHDIGSQQEFIHPNVESISYQPTEAEIRAELEFPPDYHSQNYETLSSSDSKDSGMVRDELSNAYKNKIGKLEADVRRLSEQFVARATLQVLSEIVSVIAQIDPMKKEITWIRFDKGADI